SAAQCSVHMTPAKMKGEGAYCEHDPATLNPRREKLVRDLNNKGHSPGFIQLLVKLGLADAYKAYESNVPADVFASLANDSLVVRPTSEPDALEDKSHTVDSLSSKRHKLEAAYVDTFKRLLDALFAMAKESTLPSEYQSTPYRCEDFQAERVNGSKLKPDLVFFQINNTKSDI
ncbi:hypothetical protein GGI19_006527, partial [Coemansia pectinata]